MTKAAHSKGYLWQVAKIILQLWLIVIASGYLGYVAAILAY